MDNIQENLNLIDCLSRVRLHSNDNGSTEVQIILQMINLRKKKHHIERNLLDSQVSTQQKTNRKDIDAIRSSKRDIQLIRKKMKYLERYPQRMNNFLQTLTELNIEYKKYLSTLEKNKLEA